MASSVSSNEIEVRNVPAANKSSIYLEDFRGVEFPSPFSSRMSCPTVDYVCMYGILKKSYEYSTPGPINTLAGPPLLGTYFVLARYLVDSSSFKLNSSSER